MVKHGRNGWQLADYDWSFETGVATLTYERVRPDTEEVVTKVITKAQPAGPQHAGWFKN